MKVIKRASPQDKALVLSAETGEYLPTEIILTHNDRTFTYRIDIT